MSTFPLEDPRPDFDTLRRIILGEQAPDRVHFVELGIDPEVREYLLRNIFHEEPVSPREPEEYQRQTMRFYHQMGYDMVSAPVGITNMPTFRSRRAVDTARLSRGQRNWVEETTGIIEDWEDFRSIEWDKMEANTAVLEAVVQYLPTGMKMTLGHSVFEMILENFLGYEGLFLLSKDRPELVEAVFNRWGEVVYEAYEQVIAEPAIGAIFHADDLGFKTGTLLSPDFLREIFLPWLRRYARLAHDHGKIFIYHCCGNVLEIMEDLIEDVGIDGFHSFQDVIIPASDFLRRYGDRVAALGGIDMDRIARLPENKLREYVQQVLDECMPYGRFALGTGNTVANYVPVENYLAMLEVGWTWHRSA